MTPGPEHSAEIVQRRYHASAGSALYILTTVFLAIGAINSQNNLLFFAFGLAAGAMVISGFVSGPALMRVRARRDAPHSAEVGKPIVVRYTIWNHSPLWPAFGLTISELSPLKHATGPLGSVTACVQHVGPRQTVRASSTLLPVHRGVAALDRFSVSTSFPLGLTRKSVTFSSANTLIVRPRQLRIRPGILDRLDGGVSRLSSARNVAGHGEEMYGLRTYVPGDSIRAIAWRASARAGSLVVRQTAQPAPARLWIELRPSVATLAPFDQETAISLAASIARLADSRGFAVGVTGFGSTLMPRLGRRHIERVLDLLGQLQVTSAERPNPRTPALRRDASIVISARPESAPTGALVIPVTDAAAFLAPGESLPEPPPPPVGRFRRFISEFLGLDAVEGERTP